MDLRGFEPLTSSLPVPLKSKPDQCFNALGCADPRKAAQENEESAPWLRPTRSADDHYSFVKGNRAKLCRGFIRQVTLYPSLMECSLLNSTFLESSTDTAYVAWGESVKTQEFQKKCQMPSSYERKESRCVIACPRSRRCTPFGVDPRKKPLFHFAFDCRNLNLQGLGYEGNSGRDSNRLGLQM